jgi:hypothetical protein
MGSVRRQADSPQAACISRLVAAIPLSLRWNLTVVFSNGRLLKLENGQVHFRWRGSQDHNQIKERDLPGGRRVHPAVSPACASRRVRQDPTFRISFRPQSKEASPTLPETPASIHDGDHHPGATSTTLPGLQSGPPYSYRLGAPASDFRSDGTTPPSPGLGLLIIL